MDNQRPIKFGPGDKLRLLESVAFDPLSTDFDARVAIAVTSRVDKYTGAAIIGQEWLAEKIGGTVRGVRFSTERMEARGHFQIEHSRGRGKANVYRPTKLGTRIPLSGAEMRNYGQLKEEPRDSKRGTSVPPLPNKTITSLEPLFGAATRSR